MSFRQILREYFTYNRRERNGVFVLLSIILLLIGYLIFSPWFYSNGKIDFSEFEKEIAAFEAAQDTSTDSAGEGDDEFSAPSSSRHYQYRSPDSSAHSRYRRDTLRQVLPVQKKKEPLAVELNSADSAELTLLRGIGPAFARRIIKYREILRGYISSDQLMEVYGFDRERYDQVVPDISVDLSLVKKININTASAEEMKSHPYIRWKLANVIALYRKNHGPYPSVESLRNIDLVTDSVFAKLAPYITVQ